MKTTNNSYRFDKNAQDRREAELQFVVYSHQTIKRANERKVVFALTSLSL